MRKRKGYIPPSRAVLVLAGVPSTIGKLQREWEESHSLIDAIALQGILFRMYPAIGALERVKQGIKDRGFEKHEYTPSTRYFAARKLMQMKERKLRQARGLREPQYLIKSRQLTK